MESALSTCKCQRKCKRKFKSLRMCLLKAQESLHRAGADAFARDFEWVQAIIRGSVSKTRCGWLGWFVQCACMHGKTRGVVTVRDDFKLLG